MVNNVMSLLKTVRTVEDENARGTRALEATIDAINQDIRTFVATDRVEKVYTAEELMRSTRPITLATAKAVAAGNSCRQEDVIHASNMGRKAVADMLVTCKGAAQQADSPDVKRRALDAGQTCAQAFRDLLNQVNATIHRPVPENRQYLAEHSKVVAACVTEIMHVAEYIKDSLYRYDLVDPDDPIVVAESELISAANSIEAAAKKLATLRPRVRPKEVDSDLNFDEQILEAANSIALATAALVKAASAAQKELVAQGKVGAIREDIDDDSQWSQGLISAAHMVAAATHNLCDAANAMVQGNAGEEKLISAAKQVASSTAQLLVACKVKADADSVAMKRLQAAGNSVKKATEALVRAAQQAKEGWTIEETSVTVNQRMVGGIAQIIMAKEEILIKERELEEARRKLETIQRSKYKDHQDEDEEGTAF